MARKATRKTTKKTISKAACRTKKTAKKTRSCASKSKAPAVKLSYTSNPYFKDLKIVEKKLKNCWSKLNRDARKNANLRVIAKDNDELMLLLGECNYLVNQFTQASKSL